MADGSKTEKATPKRRRDERKRGNVAMSRDVVAVATLIAAYAMLLILAPTIVKALSDLMQYCVGEMTVSGMGIEAVLDALNGKLIETLALTVGVFAAGIIVISIAATFAQTGMLVSGELLKPKLSKLNPIEGFKRLFSLKGVIETLKSILKIAVLLFIVYSNLADILAVGNKYLYTDIAASVSDIFDCVMAMIFDIIIAFTVVAAADYLYQWWDYERQLRMSKQEIKEEFKQLEGDPPSTASGNWAWRISPRYNTAKLRGKILDLTTRTKRNK